MDTTIWENIENILTELLWISSISSIFWTNIFAWLPSSEFENQTYLYITVVSDNTASGSDNFWTLTKIGRLTFSIVWSNWKTSDAELYETIWTINRAIVTQWCVWIFDWNWFEVNTVEEWSMSPIGVSTKNRPIIQKDYLFHYIV